jgi:predicted ATPase/class 3 adenylate cyclase
MTAVRPLLSFVPAVVRRRLSAGQKPEVGVEHVQGVILASDVSGFTQLAMALRATPGGVDELSSILNDGFGRLIDVIDEAGGDVIGFAGDALTAYWPMGPDAVRSAGWAALEAQRRLTEGDHRINLRIGLAVGSVAIWSVGGAEDQWFLTLTGAAAAEAAALQTQADLGHVVVSDAFLEQGGSALETETREGVHRLEAVLAGPPSAPSYTASERELGEPALDSLRPYLQPTVVARLVAGHEQFLSELRTVTAVYLRVPGLEEATDLERLQDVVATVQHGVYQYEGTLTSGVDDKGITFVAVFGAPPYAHEDDVDRALSAARGIDRELTNRDVGHGVGIATGLAFCGPKGNDVRREYTVLSDAVNIAARLAGVACDPERPSILCEQSTVDAARPRWTFDRPVSLRLKGKVELLTAFGLLHRVARAINAREAMIGRSAELQRICRFVTLPSDARIGRLVVVEGDPGIGKSSLLGAIQQTLHEAGLKVFVGFADPLERSAPLHAWTAVFAELLAMDTVRLDDVRDELLHRVGPHAPLLSTVLAVDIEDDDETESLVGEERVRATRSLLIDLLSTAIEREGSLVVLLEDAHWFDSGSWGLLADAVQMPGIGVVISTRLAHQSTERELPRVVAGSDTTRIHLEPLSADEIHELAQARLGVSEVDPAVHALLVETCRGNPFFTVELVRALAQRGALTVDADSGKAVLVDREAVQIPETIQAAITSRIDHLSADQQLSLKVASVIGSTFTIDVLAHVHPTGRSSEDVLEDLRALGEGDLVVPSEAGTYDFNHALTQEVAYSLMMGDQRRELHRSLASFYEEAEDPELLYPALAHHWLRAENDEKAVTYLTLAAVSSLAHGMPRESVDHGVNAARVLGIELETDPSKIMAMLPGELAEIDRLMAGRRPSDLVDLPELIDESIGKGIAIVFRSMPSAHQSLQTELFALMAVRNLNLTLRFGASVFAPGVYAMYSIVLRGLGADSAIAYEFSELARTVDAASGNPLAAAVSFIHVWFNNHWFNPLRSSIPIAMAGAEAGLAGSDTLYGSFNLAAATTALATGGGPLEEVIEMGERHLERIGLRSATASFHNRLEAQMAKALSGRTDRLTSLSGEGVDEAELAAMEETANYNQTAYYYIAKLRLAYLAGDPLGAQRYADKAYELLPSFGAQPGQGELTILAGLAQLADPSVGAESRAAALEEAREKLAQLEAWAANCPANFAHKANLLRGELAAAEGEGVSADAFFAAAEERATADGFPQWAALARERRGHAVLATSQSRAREHFAAAAAHYLVWGASLKADELAALAEG